MVKSLEHGKEISGPVKKGGCIEQKSNIQVLKTLSHRDMSLKLAEDDKCRA